MANNMTSQNRKAAIELKHVSYTDDGRTIINDISGAIAEGRITTLVGPSGAGKTTLFRLCNGLISPDHGSVKLYGEDISTIVPTELRRTVGLSPQSATMLGGTVFKNLGMPLTLQGKQLPEAEALQLLEDVGLEAEYLNRNVKELSGGQRQKVSIARTLVNKPKVLLLDEITSALDRVSKQEIEALIKEINLRFNVTIVWITHNLEQALTIGDDTWVMMNGRLVESGESSLLENPKNDLVRRFVKGEIE